MNLLRASSLKNAWLAVALAHLALIIHLIIYRLTPGTGQSTSFLVLALGTGVYSLVVMAFAYLYNDSIHQWLLRLPRLVRLAGAVLAYILLFVFSLLIRPEAVYVHIALSLGLAVCLLVQTLFPAVDGKGESNTRWMVLIAILVGLIVLSRVLNLSYAPAMQVNDEGWLLAWPISLLEDGQFSDRLMYFGGHDVHGYYYGMALWFKLVGVGFYQGRLFSLLVIMLVIAITALTARRWFGTRTAALLVLFMMASDVVLIGARVRHDAGLALSIALSLYFYTVAHQSTGTQSRRLLIYGLAGAVMGLGLLSHYHVAGFSIAMGIGLFLPLYILQLREGKWFPQSPVWAYLVGGIIGVGLAVLIQIVPQWEGFISTRSSRAPEATNYFLTVLSHINSIAIHSYYEAILLGIGIVMAIWKRDTLRIQLALVVILAHLSLGVMAKAAWDHYPMPLTPLYALLSVVAIADIARWLAQNSATTSRWILYALVLLSPVLGQVVRIELDNDLTKIDVIRPVPPVINWIDEHIPPGALIQGEHYYYHWLFEYDYVSPLSHALMPDDDYYAMGEFEGVWSQIPVDFYLLDYNLNTCCIMQRLIDSGHLDRLGYEIVYEQNGIVIYGDPDVLR